MSMKPVEVEIVLPLLTTIGFSCAKCTPIFDQLGLYRNYRDSCTDEYPEDWKQIADSLSRWMERAHGLYRHRIRIRMVDAQSPLGLWKQLRHRLSQFPAFIVEGSSVFTGRQLESLEAAIDERIRQAAEDMKSECRSS